MSVIEPKDFIILGSSRFKTLTQYELDKFLDYAQLQGINKIDTAPLYESEKMIGNYHKNNQHFSVMTKLPIPFYGDTFKQVESSLDKLRVNKLQCLFTHALRIEQVTLKLMADFYFLKQQKVIHEVGYSGSNFTEKDLDAKGGFTSLMITFNGLDIGAYDLISTTLKQVYIKRPFANFVFDYKEINSFKTSIKSILRKKNPVDQNSYEFRFKKMSKEFEFGNNKTKFFYDFILTYAFGHKYCMGISSIEHLKKILSMSTSIDEETVQNMKTYFERIKELDKIYKFTQLS